MSLSASSRARLSRQRPKRSGSNACSRRRTHAGSTPEGDDHQQELQSQIAVYACKSLFMLVNRHGGGLELITSGRCVCTCNIYVKNIYMNYMCIYKIAHSQRCQIPSVGDNLECILGALYKRAQRSSTKVPVGFAKCGMTYSQHTRTKWSQRNNNNGLSICFPPMGTHMATSMERRPSNVLSAAKDMYQG